MRIEWAIMCRDVAQGAATGISIIGAGIDTHRASSFPTTIEVIVAVSYVQPYSQIQRQSEPTISVKIVGPNLDPVGEMNGTGSPMTIESPDEFPEGWEGRSIQAIRLGVAIAEPGTHTLELRADDDKAPITLPFRVLPLD